MSNGFAVRSLENVFSLKYFLIRGYNTWLVRSFLLLRNILHNIATICNIVAYQRLCFFPGEVRVFSQESSLKERSTSVQLQTIMLSLVLRWPVMVQQDSFLKVTIEELKSNSNQNYFSLPTRYSTVLLFLVARAITWLAPYHVCGHQRNGASNLGAAIFQPEYNDIIIIPQIFIQD